MYRPLAPSTGDRTARRVVLEVVLKLMAVYTAIRVLAFAVLGPLIIVGAVSDLYSRSSHYEASIEAGVSIYVATFGLSTLFSSAKIVLRSSPVFTSMAARLGVKSAMPDPPPTTPVGGRARP